MSATGLSEALAAAEAALGRGDAQAAADAVERGAAACQAMATRGERLSGSQLALLRAAHARCVTLADGERARLAAEVGRAARSRRAADAYRR